ncbi:MAG: glucosyltransferase domain-containing protein [Bacteroidales bacterium]|nr:glucosyltransferase domain-containing protein [Lachnoclostridium sp.]MCM1383448.1 glucosyltransferase domain-containing protein [Lachnoclostridium sp.]MCM1464297.1 glucosyltransferase domain-containing protein [Bacteroidales bacterium]
MREFYKKNKKAFFLAFVYTALCFGFMLTHFVPHIDEETWLLNDNDSILWLLQNRYTVYLYNLFFTEHGRFVPFFATVAGIFFWNVSGFLFANVFFDFEKKDRFWLRTLLLCYYSSIPFCMGEAFAFSMLMIPESFGMILVALAFLLTVKPAAVTGNRLKSSLCALCSILFLAIALGAYQALICIYVTAVAGWCLCRFLEDKSFKPQLLLGILFCTVSTGLYYIINLAVAKAFGTASYLSANYVGWTNGENILFNLFMALANVGRISFAIPFQGVYVYGGATLRIITVLFLLFSIAVFFKKKGAAKKAGVILFTLGILLAPFALYIALGTYKTQGRMMIALPLAGMIELLLMFRFIQKPYVERFFYIFLLAVLCVNASNMNRIYYHNYLVYQRDQSIAREIIHDLKRTGYDYHNKPVVFIGKVEQEDMGTSASGTLGASFFEWDDGNIGRMADFIKLEGCALRKPSSEQITAALTVRESMQLWPLEDSIREMQDYIVIYLSEPSDEWYRTNL